MTQSNPKKPNKEPESELEPGEVPFFTEEMWEEFNDNEELKDYNEVDPRPEEDN